MEKKGNIKCSKCDEFRELSLHIYELSLLCDRIDRKNKVYKLVNKEIKEVSTALTVNIAKWLKLSSQIQNVELNPYKYEEAHLYCGPVYESLESKSKHHSSIITPLTQFIFILNALEESYRYISSLYQEEYIRHKEKDKKLERKFNFSAQASWLLDISEDNSIVPLHYHHKVENYLEIVNLYKNEFNLTFDIELKYQKNLSYGLSLVRNIRNHISHGVFPIIEDPNYTLEFANPKTKRMVLNLLGYSTRIATMNIQMLLFIGSDRFKLDNYIPTCDEFLSNIPTLSSYINNLHLEQDFGLNETSQLSLYDLD